MHFVRPDLNQNFKEALVGVIVTNSWLFIEGLEFLQLQMANNLNFLMTLALKIDNARKFKENFVEVLGKEIDLGSSVNIFLSRSNLYSLLCPLSELGLVAYRQLKVICNLKVKFYQKVSGSLGNTLYICMLLFQNSTNWRLRTIPSDNLV